MSGSLSRERVPPRRPASMSRDDHVFPGPLKQSKPGGTRGVEERMHSRVEVPMDGTGRSRPSEPGAALCDM